MGFPAFPQSPVRNRERAGALWAELESPRGSPPYRVGIFITLVPPTGLCCAPFGSGST